MSEEFQIPKVKKSRNRQNVKGYKPQNQVVQDNRIPRQNRDNKQRSKPSSPPSSSKPGLHNRAVTINYEVRDPLISSSPNSDPSIVRSKNVIYVRTGNLSYNEVDQAMSVAVDLANKVHHQLTGKYEDGNYLINMPSNAQGFTFNFCYVWLASIPLSNLLSTRNIDGSQRVEEIVDPNWQPPAPKEKEDQGFEDVDRWCDYDEEEEQVKPPTITRRLHGLVGRLFVHYVREQKDLQQPQDPKNIGGIENVTPPPEVRGICAGYGVTLDFDLSFANLPPDEFQHNVLCSISVPHQIHNDTIRTAFAPFSNSTNPKFPIVSSGYSTEKGRNVFVSYDPSSSDAIFALQMMKCCRLQPTGSKPGDEKVVLIFKHAKIR